MPKGKKKGKGGASGKSSKSAASKSGQGDNAEETGDHHVDRETLLRNELETITNDIELMKVTVQDLKEENDFLQLDATNTRNETHEYMSYMAKKTNKRQSNVISISDYHKKQMEDIAEDKKNMLEKYDDKKRSMKEVILSKEVIFANLKMEFEDLHEFRTLQHEQATRIKDLEREVYELRIKHTERIYKLKAQFYEQKKEFTEKSHKQIQDVEKRVDRDAHRCLVGHTDDIKKQNRTLRAELYSLIQHGKIMQKHKEELIEQKKILLREHEYNKDLRQMKTVKYNSDALKNFGL